MPPKHWKTTTRSYGSFVEDALEDGEAIELFAATGYIDSRKPPVYSDYSASGRIELRGELHGRKLKELQSLQPSLAKKNAASEFFSKPKPQDACQVAELVFDGHPYRGLPNEARLLKGAPPPWAAQQAHAPVAAPGPRPG